jgi:hypothetical protein
LDTLVLHGHGTIEIRLQLHALAYTFGAFLRALTCRRDSDRLLTSLQTRLINTGATAVRYAGAVT